MYRRIVFLLFLLAGWSCSNDEEQEIDCSTLRLVLKNTSDPETCSPPDGEIRVFAMGGTQPYQFHLSGGALQSDSVFTALQGGTYKVEVVDAQDCTFSLDVTLTNFNTDLTSGFEVVPDTDCLTGNGAATFNPSGGTPPYQIKYKNTFVTGTLELTGLKSGFHQVAIVDDQSCEFVMAVNIPKGKTVTSWASQIKPIIDTRCAKSNCHVAGTGRSDLSKFDNVKELAAQIKIRTQNGSMPFDEPMPASQIQL
ncbi:MAG: SprB repeat-containing protein, partial [Cyclobacteriaceae bacterium]